MKNSKTDALIILWVSAGVVICLIPFIILRVMQQDWIIAVLNSLAVLCSLITFLYVYYTGNTRLARIVLSCLSLTVMTSTVYLKGAEQIVWMYPSITIVFYLLSPKKALVICLGFIVVITSLILPESGLLFIAKFVVSALATALFCFAFSSKMRLLTSRLSQLALSDVLTGAGNRRALDYKLERIANRLKRYPEQSCSLIIFDLDYFKHINDNYGHGVGDDVLRKFVVIVENRIRSSDFIYRYGGEEFVVVLENTEISDAMILAKNLGHELKEVTWDCNGLCVTVSSGVAQFRMHDSPQSWIARADSALYQAKQAGRDCCMTHPSDAMHSARQLRQKVA